MLLRSIVVAACVLLPACSAESGEPSGDELDAGVPPTTAVVVTPTGFDRVVAKVTTADGDVCEICLWLAADDGERLLGLMFVNDLGPANGMAFVYDTAPAANFWMKNTLLPLSIAFFDADGTHLQEFDMEPCDGDPCEKYRTPRGFRVAVETEQGGLADVGIGPGSSLKLTDLPCGDEPDAG